MDESPLGRLPAELRNAIYKNVLFIPWGVQLTVVDAPKHGHTLRRCNASGNLHMELTRVCKKIRAETMGLFFSQNTFSIDHAMCEDDMRSWVPSAAQAWLDHIGEQAYRIKEITICLPDIDVGYALTHQQPHAASQRWLSAYWYGCAIVDWTNLVVSNGIPLRLHWNMDEIERASDRAQLPYSDYIIFATIDTRFDGDWHAFMCTFHAQIDESCKVLSAYFAEDWEQHVSSSDRDNFQRLAQDRAHARASSLVAILEAVHAQGRGNYYWEPHRLRCTPRRG